MPQMKTTRLLVLALCLLCAGLAFGLPKKKNKNNNNNKVSNSVAKQEEDSDLIPIPDHLLDDYKNSGKIQSQMNQVASRSFKQSLVWLN